MAARTTGLVEVALPVPLYQTFIYEVRAGMQTPEVGSRVVVPFRRQQELGICLGPPREREPPRRIRAILDVPDDSPALSSEMVALCNWMAEYYVAPVGLAMRAALPALLAGAARPVPPRKSRRIVRIRQDLPTLTHREKVFARSPQQRALFELLESLGGSSTMSHLVERLAFSPSVLKGLETRGLVLIEKEELDRDPFSLRPRDRVIPHVPTAAQMEAIRRLSSAGPGETYLLHGVTGSGKTLVYIELLKRIVQQEAKTAIVLVPEIALTPQTVDRFRAVFGDSIAVLHSALSDGERYDAWLALRRGDKRIAVGARSAVFAPLRNIGAIVVDEEHEASYKQGETPRYHARELAVMRAHLEGAVAVLGSATPSLESWANAASGKYQLMSLPDRVGGGALPSVEIVDLRRRPSPTGGSRRLHQTTGAARTPGATYESVIRAELDAAIAATLLREEQVILLLNRRGYSAFMQCRDCGNVMTCPNCSITLTLHTVPERLLCHYCGYQEEVKPECPHCGGESLKQRGLGTQQVERLIVERFPQARIARMDVDTTSGKWAHAEILDRVETREIDILLGTQMIAKGLDFPNVTLVGVVDADVGINLPDFRASERSFQLLSQVAGRTGRGKKGGTALIQTRLPGHHAVTCAVAHDYPGFVRAEIASRRDPAYPPHVRLANIVFSSADVADASDSAIRAGDWLRALVGAQKLKQVSVVGAAPCPIERIKSRWRWHVLLKSSHPGTITRLGRYFMEKFEAPPHVRVSLDRDPVALL